MKELVSDHSLGVFRLLPYAFHLAVDFLVSVVFLLAPLAWGFSGLDAFYYWLNAVAVLTVVSLHKPQASPQLATA